MTMTRPRVLVSILLGVLVFAAISYAGFTTKPVYSARAVLYFREPEQRSSSLQGGLSALSSLAGVQSDAQIWSEREIGRITSRSNLNDFVRRHQLLEQLLREKVIKRPKVGRLDEEQIAKALRAHIDFMPRSKSGWVEMVVSTPRRDLSQFIAVNLLGDYVQDRRQELVAESERNLAYLRGKLSSETNQDLRYAITKLGADEMSRAVLVRSTRGLGVELIDPPYTPENGKRLATVLIIGSALFAGLLTAFGTWVFLKGLGRVISENRDESIV